MVRVLDTALLPPGERVDAVDAAVRYARLPAVLRPQIDPADFDAQVDVWDSGGGTEFLHWSGSAYTISRGARQAAAADEHRVAVTVTGPGTWRWRQHATEQVVRSDRWDVILVDHAAGYEFTQHDTLTTYAFNLDVEALGVGADQIRRVTSLRASPLYDLVIEHMVATCSTLDEVRPGPATTLIGSATADLVRALITTAGGQAGRDVDQAPLLEQTKLYIGRHLTDPGLSPRRMAQAHAVSLRTLYQVWSGHDPSLAEYVMRRRLDLAHRLLAEPHERPPAIAELARRCGFVDMAHFSRRFRRAYGMSPREWRHLCREAGRLG